MKSLVILALIVIALFAAVSWWLMHETMSDQGTWVAFAFGNESADEIEVHIPVDMGMTMRERPKFTDKGDLHWEEWVAEHWQIMDEAGEPLPIQRMGHSLIISDEKARSNPEFYIKAKLKTGKQYTIEYKPKRAEKLRYRHTLTAPAEAQKVTRLQFPPYEEES